MTRSRVPLASESNGTAAWLLPSPLATADQKNRSSASSVCPSLSLSTVSK